MFMSSSAYSCRSKSSRLDNEDVLLPDIGDMEKEVSLLFAHSTSAIRHFFSCITASDKFLELALGTDRKSFLNSTSVTG